MIAIVMLMIAFIGNLMASEPCRPGEPPPPREFNLIYVGQADLFVDVDDDEKQTYAWIGDTFFSNDIEHTRKSKRLNVLMRKATSAELKQMVFGVQMDRSDIAYMKCDKNIHDEPWPPVFIPGYDGLVPMYLLPPDEPEIN